jgi:hypothetical protein
MTQEMFCEELLSQFVEIGNEFGFHSEQAHSFVLDHCFCDGFVKLALETYKNLYETSRLEIVK